MRIEPLPGERLMRAVHRKDLPALRECLASPSDPAMENALDKHRSMALDAAISGDWADGVAAIAFHGPPAGRPGRSAKALFGLCHEKEPWAWEAASALLAMEPDLDERDHMGRTFLHKAASSGNLTLARMLAEHGARPDTRCSHGLTPLGEAARRNSPKLIETLLRMGADPNFPDARGGSALMRGADQRRTDALARLIQAGADVHRENIEGTTALMIALKAGSEPAATALMDAGADPRRANLHGLSALSAAKRMPAGPARELVIQRARMLDEREALSQASGAAPSPPRSAQGVRTL